MSGSLSEIQSNQLNYIPNSFLDKYIRKNSNVTTIPSAHHSRALILSTNILHFSHVTQQYLKDYQNGLEIITNFHKSFIELIQEHIIGTGADMLRYNTDRVLFYWEIPSVDTEKCLDILSNVIVYKILQLKKVLKERLMNQGVKMCFSFVLTEGSFTTFSLGSKNSIDFVHSGHSLLEGLEGPRLENNDISVLVSQSIVERIHNDFRVNVLDSLEDENDAGPTFYIVIGVGEGSEVANLSIEGVDLRRLVKPEQFNLIFNDVGSYIPKCLESYIKSGNEEWGNEIRKATVMLINIPLEFKYINTEEGLSILQDIITSVKKYTQGYSGSIYRMYFDSKALHIFVVFGLYPDCHIDDSVRCIFSALAIEKSLGKKEIPAYIGISSGEVLLSICGTFQKDLFILGEPFYTAFILSLVAMKDGVKRIIVDFESKVAAENKLSFCLYKNPAFTGKIAEGIFEVVYAGVPLPALPYEPFPEIRTHHFNVDYSNSIIAEDKITSLFMTGRDTELQSAKRIFTQFLKAPTKPNVLLLVGSYGVGKSLFAKNLLENMNETVNKIVQKESQPLILVSSLNPGNRNKKLNGWKAIMKEILARLALTLGQLKEEVLETLLSKEPDLKSNIHLLRDILDLSNPPNDGQFDESSFLQEETNHILPFEQKTIVTILTAMLQSFLGEKVTFREGQPKEGSSTGKVAVAPLVICLDDLQEHDELSWNLLIQVTRKLQKVFIIGLLRDDEMSPRRMRNIESGLKELGANQSLVLNKITLDPLRQEEIGALIKRILGEREPNDDLKKFVSTKCQGNPLLVINMLEALLKQGLMQEVTGVVFPTENLSRLISLGEYIEIKVPSTKQKQIGALLDSLPFAQYNLLKIASIIGETFDLKSLVVANPFQYSLVPYNVLVSSLHELRQIGVLDLVDGKSNNTSYKFGYQFLRETLYQRIGYSLRRNLHRIIALNYEDMLDKYPKGDQKVLYHWDLSEQGPEESYKNRTDRTRRSYILKRINAILTQPTRRGDLLIKTGSLEKKSFKTEGKWTPRFGALTQNGLKYYRTQQDFDEKPVLEAGTIILKGITAISPTTITTINNQEKAGLRILTEKWAKGHQQYNKREFVFACENEEEVEDWQISMEYMRNKAIYEDFLQNYDVKDFNARPGSLKGKNTSLGYIKTEESDRPNIKAGIQNLYQEAYKARELSIEGGSPTRKVKIQEVGSKNSSPLSYRGDSEDGDNINSPIRRQRNKELVKNLFGKGQIVFWSYLFNAPLKASLKGQNFGKNPDIVRDKPDLLRIDSKLLQKEPGSDVTVIKRDPFYSKLSFDVDRTIAEKITSFDKGKMSKNPGSKYVFTKESGSIWPSKSVRSEDVEESFGSGSIRIVPSLEGLHEEFNIVKKETKSGRVRGGNNDAFYMNENFTETIEEVTKTKPGRSYPRSKRSDLSIDNGKSISTRVAFGLKGLRDLSKPNIYGRFIFFPTFFIDSYVDDKLIASRTNNVIRKDKFSTVTKKNIPNAGEMVFTQKFEGGVNVLTMNEESHERRKDGNQRTTVKSSRLEDEEPIYQPTRKIKDYVRDSYSTTYSKGSDQWFERPSEKQDTKKSYGQPYENSVYNSDYFASNYSPDNSLRGSIKSAYNQYSHSRNKSDITGVNPTPNERVRPYEYEYKDTNTLYEPYKPTNNTTASSVNFSTEETDALLRKYLPSGTSATITTGPIERQVQSQQQEQVFRSVSPMSYGISFVFFYLIMFIDNTNTNMNSKPIKIREVFTSYIDSQDNRNHLIITYIIFLRTKKL